MFCNSQNNPDEKQPNVNVCPVCMGHPGTLPVINKEAVKQVLKVGVAVGGELADFTEFDRKNYFYPDIPKGYQISQYKYPLVSGGELAGVKLTRIHLEEDTARSSHESGAHSLVDFNRAGVPLMELVTEPVIHSAEEAVSFAKELQLLLWYLGVSEANMEKGEMRVEANISVLRSDLESGKRSDLKLGTKVEVKNLNSFRIVGKAIEYEVKRHIGLLEKGEKVVQETRGWDENKSQTFSQRTKEDSHDYRYFPEPDLPKLKISEVEEFSVGNLKKELPELPEARRARYLNIFGLKKDDAEMLVADFALANFFEQSAMILKGNLNSISLLANYVLSDLVGLIKKDKGEMVSITEAISKIKPEAMAELVVLIKAGEISSRGAKDILALMYQAGGNPKSIAETNELFQKSNQEELEVLAKKVITDNPKAVALYKSGKEASLQFLIGQGMKLSKGSANPKIFSEVILRLI